MPRCNLVTQIQIAKRQLGMDDDDYRAMLERVTGKRSSTGLPTADKRAVIAELKRKGFKPYPRKGGSGGGRRWRSASKHEFIRQIWKIWWLLGDAGVVEKTHAAANAFVSNPKFAAKWGEPVTDVDFLTVERANDVINALRDVARRNKVALKL